MEYFMVKVASSKGRAKKLLTLMQEQEIDELEIPDLPIKELDRFLDKERKNIWDITINGEVLMSVVADEDSANAFRMMLTTTEGDSFPLAPIKRSSVEDYLAGKREDILSLEIARTKNAEEVPKEELPGHIK
jgi:hypothetical protein